MSNGHLTDRAQRLVRHYERQYEKIAAYKHRHGHKLTTRRNHQGDWVPCRWNELCTEALDIYADFIAELKSGTYRFSEGADRRT